MKVLPEANYERAARAARQAIKAINTRILDRSAPPGVPRWIHNSKPYLNAIRDKDYGFEDPCMVVLYALNNMTNWRGDEARAVKAELNACLEER